jgi:hypothetical protein
MPHHHHDPEPPQDEQMTQTPSSPAAEHATPDSAITEGWRRPAARVFYSATAAGAADYARALVPVVAEDDLEDGTYIAQARHLRAWALEVLAAAVLAERTRGATWRQVAAALGYDVDAVRARWEPVEQAWLAGEDVEIDGLTLRGLTEPPASRADARKIAERLDTWCARYSAIDNARGRRAVSDALDGL